MTLPVLHLVALCLLSLVTGSIAFDISRFDNVAVYWGQDSYGATHSSDPANFQKPLSFYCGDNAIDIFPVAFVTTFFGTGGLPVLNLANTCNNVDNATFPGSQLANCAALASDITTCQSKGKIVTISLGGAGGTVGFSSDAQATSFADQIWNLFLGGSSTTRPFGSAVLDGVDLDIEGGSTTGYPAFVNQLRSHFSGASKRYYITAAPQCVFPDASLGAVLNAASFDAVYVQFYNNACGLQNFATASDWDFGLWDNWARNTSINKNAKVFIGAPASSTAAGSGFQDPTTLANIATQMRKSFPSFGGVMLWDASQAFVNSRYDLAIKNALVAAGGTGFTFPPCSAPAFAPGTNYQGGSQVSFQGYVWQAKFFASSTPANDPNNEWSAISACSGTGASPSSTPASSTPPATSSTPASSTAPVSSSTPASSTAPVSSTAPASSSTVPVSSSSASPSSTATPVGANCAGVQAWNTSVAYVGGSNVTSGGHLWTAKWWSEADVPGGVAGDWTDDGPCASPAVLATMAPAVSGQGKVGVAAKPTPATLSAASHVPHGTLATVAATHAPRGTASVSAKLRFSREFT